MDPLEGIDDTLKDAIAQGADVIFATSPRFLYGSLRAAARYPDTRILVCPAVTRGLSRETCWDTAAGYDKVMQELEKCGTYFRGEKMYRKTVR